MIVDISGSMSRYSRMFLHFLHAITTGRDAANHRVHSFLFGTRLTHITRQLAARDPDVAVSAVVQAVEDWSGGTRITQALHEFNLRWARRVLYGNPTVLLVTDGLEHGDTEAARARGRAAVEVVPAPDLAQSAAALRGLRAARRGVRALLPHVDAFLPVHNLASLEDLATQLTAPARAMAPVRRSTTVELKGERLLPVSREIAWAALNDIDALKAAVPGCESIVADRRQRLRRGRQCRIGPVKARFKGKLELADVQAPESYTIRFDMQGGAAGFSRGEARVRLEAVDANTTPHAVRGQCLDRRQDRTDRLAAGRCRVGDDGRSFLQRRSLPISPRISAGRPARRPSRSARPGFFATLWEFLKRLFGGTLMRVAALDARHSPRAIGNSSLRSRHGAAARCSISTAC